MCNHCELKGVSRIKEEHIKEFKSDSWQSWEEQRSPFDMKYYRVFSSGIKEQLENKTASSEWFDTTIRGMYQEIGTHFAKLLFQGGKKSLQVDKMLFVNYDSSGRTIQVNEQLDEKFIGSEIVIRDAYRRTIRSIDGFKLTLDLAINVRTGDAVQVLKSDFDIFVILFVKQLIDNYLTNVIARKVLGLTSTTQKDIALLTAFAQELREANPDYSDTKIQRLVTDKLNKIAKDRAKVITNSEVAEASNLGGYISANLGLRKKKTWISRRDDRVRNSHIAMEGISIPIDEIFNVPSAIDPATLPIDLMRFPKDSSLGADLSNIINCRCAADYE